MSFVVVVLVLVVVFCLYFLVVVEKCDFFLSLPRFKFAVFAVPMFVFSYPALFKGFVSELQIAKSEKDITSIYQNLIKAAPQSKFVEMGRDYSEINTSIDDKSNAT